MISLIIPTLDMDKGQATVQEALNLAGICADARVIVDHNREGYSATVNRGLRLAYEAGYDVCVLNDDCHPHTEGWLWKLHQATKPKRVWFAGPSGPCRTPPQNRGFVGDNRKPMIVSHVAGFCLYAEFTVMKEVGFLNESLTHYGSDVDWQWRARALGGHTVWVPGVYVDHELHAPREPLWTQDNRTFSKIWQ